MSKLIIKGEEARKRLKNGIAALADAVASTMSTAGSNAVIDTDEDAAFITGDGISVAEAFELIEPIEQIGVSMAKHICRQTNFAVQDGTTTSIVLGNEILQNDYMIKDCVRPRVEKGMRNAVKDVIAHLEKHKCSITEKEELINVATISARGDREMGQLIADAYTHIGEEGQIIVEEAREDKSYVEYITGYQIEKGYYNEIYVNNNKRGTSDYENPLIFITDMPIEDVKILEKILNIPYAENKPLILISPEISRTCEAVLNANYNKGSIKVCYVEAPEIGLKQELILTDLAYLTKGRFISSIKGDKLLDITLQDFGTCETFIGTKTYSGFINFPRTNEEVDEYIENMLQDSDEEFNKKRTARLKGKLSKIYVGGAKTPIEMKEKRDRVDDACGAVKAALEEGFVVGGGLALYRASKDLKSYGETKDEKAGYELILKSIQKPLNQILDNLFKEGEVTGWRYVFGLGKKEKVLKQIEKSDYNYGYDVKDLELCNFMMKGIIDPIKVTKASLNAAFSVAITILSTNVVIAVVGENRDLKL